MIKVSRLILRRTGWATGKRKRKKRAGLRRSDFAGDGEPYTEVIVTISIRVLDDGITRSRLAVNVYPDPALERMARESLRALKKESYGYNEDGVFGACLSKNFNAWADMEDDYPRIDERYGDRSRQEDAKQMNEYVAESVQWALGIHKAGMQEAAKNELEDFPVPPGRVM